MAEGESFLQTIMHFCTVHYDILSMNDFKYYPYNYTFDIALNQLL